MFDNQATVHRNSEVTSFYGFRNTAYKSVVCSATLLFSFHVYTDYAYDCIGPTNHSMLVKHIQLQIKNNSTYLQQMTILI